MNIQQWQPKTMCVSAITVTLYTQVHHILCEYKSLFLCHINELICILLHMRMNVIYKMCTWSNKKVKIAQISERCVFIAYCRWKSVSFHNIKVESCMGFDLDKATIISIKMFLLKDCINERYMRVLFHFDVKL